MAEILPFKRASDEEIDAAIQHVEALLRTRRDRARVTLGAIDSLLNSARSEVRALEARRAELQRIAVLA
jgi:uracil-DNA glycosylase